MNVPLYNRDKYYRIMDRTQSNYANQLKRISKDAKRSDFILIYYSMALIVYALSAEFYPGLFDSTWTSYSSIILSTIVLIYSIVNSKAGYPERISKIQTALNEVKRLKREVGSLPNFSHNDTDINQEIESLMTQVTENEQRISEAIDENKRILQSLHEKNDALSECNVLINRYQELTTQYGADLKRLSFIVDGTANMPQISETQCPFCDGKIRIEKTPNYIEAAKSDYKKIKLQAKDLQKAYDELLAEKDILESSIESLLAKKQSAEELVANKLTPKANQLKEKIAEYKKTLEYQNEISFLKKLVEQKTSDIIDTESLGESENKFKVKDYFDYSFVSEFGKWIKLFLEDCKYPNLTSLIFDKATMDIVLNGKKKSANGKGYNAYLNSAVAIVLSRYMQKHAHYAPGLILLDSPILSLKEIDTQKPSQSMRSGLFENIASTSEGIQTIVIENEIPEIDYSNVNLIHFTKNANTGRYGFLIDVMD